VLGMIRERLKLPDAANGFILDGFPRNIAQAEALEKMLEDLGTPLEAVVLMNLDLGILFKRLTGRRICQDCGRVFNVYTSPPDGKHRVVQRPDDKEEVIGKRLAVYEAQTKPLIKYYESAGLLRIVDADADVDTVFKNIERAVQDHAAVNR
jgi:adenylate kinase